MTAGWAVPFVTIALTPAVHRKHHAFTDREGDPHSPRLLGFWRVQLFNLAYAMREVRNTARLRIFAPDLRPDRLDRVMFSHGIFGLGVGLSLLCTLVGFWPGLIAGLLHAVLYVFVIAHQRGRPLARRQELREHRVQLALLGVDHRRREPPQQPSRPPPLGEVQRASVGVRSFVADPPVSRGGRAACHPGTAHRMDARHPAQEHAMNVFAFSTSRASEWRWRIVNLKGETLEESSARFLTIVDALAAGAEQLQVHRDRDRPPPAQASWRRRR